MEVDTTGDGLLARFDGPAPALHCAAAIQRAARAEGLLVRAAVHVGEVELVGRERPRRHRPRGRAHHGQAEGDEILVSETDALHSPARTSSFEDRGVHTLKGLDGEWRLSRFVTTLMNEGHVDERPFIFAVDPDPRAIQRITGELQRYSADYRVICGPSPEAALDQLERMREEGARVAIVLAARGNDGLRGEELLARVYDLHPHAKRALLIPWGGWADEETADVIRRAMTLGHIDYYVLKPWTTPDELFHRIVSEFLQEWRRATEGRLELTVVADRWSSRGYEIRNLLAGTAFRTRSTRATPRRLATPADVRVLGSSERARVVLPDDTVLHDPSDEDLAEHGLPR